MWQPRCSPMGPSTGAAWWRFSTSPASWCSRLSAPKSRSWCEPSWAGRWSTCGTTCWPGSRPKEDGTASSPTSAHPPGKLSPSSPPESSPPPSPSGRCPRVWWGALHGTPHPAGLCWAPWPRLHALAAPRALCSTQTNLSGPRIRLPSLACTSWTWTDLLGGGTAAPWGRTPPCIGGRRLEALIAPGCVGVLAPGPGAGLDSCSEMCSARGCGLTAHKLPGLELSRGGLADSPSVPKTPAWGFPF